MYQFVRRLDRTIIDISPHLASAFRESIYNRLVVAPRLEAAGSSSGIFEAEIVYGILQEIQTVIRQLGLATEVPVVFPFTSTKNS